jgi:hypothetical protein
MAISKTVVSSNFFIVKPLNNPAGQPAKVAFYLAQLAVGPSASQ